MRMLLVPLSIGVILTACNQTDEEVALSDIAAAEVEQTAGWEALDRFVGKHPLERSFYEDSVIAPRISRLLGDKLPVLKENSQTAAPLQNSDAVLFTSGNKDNMGGSDAFYLLVDQSAEAIEIALWEGGEMTVYKTPGTNIAKPADIELMIANMIS